MEREEIKSKSIEITEEIYKRYGTDSGILLGLAPEQKAIVKIIVGLTLEINSEEM